jgi:hypothetical protein
VTAATPYGPAEPAAGAPAPAPARRANPLGVTALALAAAAVVIRFVAAVASAALIGSLSSMGGGYELYGVVTFAFALVEGLLALAAVIVGIAGLVAKDRPRTLAGIGLGAGAAVLLGVVSGSLTSGLIALFSR